MARSDAVWGIDIGNASLKALRCRPNSQPDMIQVDAFDYIEYPRILSQPGADPAELIAEALQQFLLRNDVRGDRVAISVSGQSGLARFIKLPPVEAKKIPDIVRYEAKQQIPFDLEDVVWDYQRMGAGNEEEGFILETEIGLFAMKRDQVFRALSPFQTAGIEVDLVQLTPLSLYNFVAFDQLNDLPSADEYDPEEPPESLIVLSMGTDATDLVVTNGFRVWQRSIPLGGNHFTKALTKELKLTFAKAEHLKRNATAAQDPKAVFQAMRPVFNDILTEIQRSIGYFTTIDRSAKIGRMVTLGNAMKLPGLRRYLAQSLGFDVVRLDSFRGLVGPEVLAAPAFKENQLCFGVCYGLTLQALGQGSLQTNLLPKEILQDRLIRRKKPWAVAAAAGMLLACTISFMGYSHALGTVGGEPWKDAEEQASKVVEKSTGLKTEKDQKESEFRKIEETGEHLTSNVEGRLVWLELLRAVNQCLPGDPDEERPEDISARNEVHITNLECQKTDDLAGWFAAIERNGWYEAPPDEGQSSTAPAADTVEGEAGEEGAVAGPDGEGWIVQLTGYHYHNRDTAEAAGSRYAQGAQFVREELIARLRNEEIELPTPDGQGTRKLSMKEFGIDYPVLLRPGRPVPETVTKGGTTTSSGRGYGGPGMYGGGDLTRMMEDGSDLEMMGDSVGEVEGRDAQEEEKEDDTFDLLRFDFTVQFVWKPTSAVEREDEKNAQQGSAEAEQSDDDTAPAGRG